MPHQIRRRSRSELNNTDVAVNVMMVVMGSLLCNRSMLPLRYPKIRTSQNPLSLCVGIAWIVAGLGLQQPLGDKTVEIRENHK